MKKTMGLVSALAMALCCFLVAACSTPGVSSESISGRVTTSSGAGVKGVAVTLRGPSSTTTADTNVDGEYSFCGIGSGNYTIRPEKTGYIFGPVSGMVSFDGTEITSVDFTATETTGPVYSVSGAVISAGAGLPGVKVELSGGAAGSACTDANGEYSFPGLLNGSYAVIPIMDQYDFCPASDERTVNNSDIANVNFDGSVVAGAGTVVEMLRNKDFEGNDGTGNPMAWGFIKCYGGSEFEESPYIGSWTEESSHSSTHSLKISSSYSNEMFSYWYQRINTFETGVVPTLKVFIKTNGVTGSDRGAVLSVEYAYPNYSDNILTVSKYDIKGTHDWTEYSLSLPAISDQVLSIDVYLILGSDTQGDVYFDDVSLSYVEE